MIISSRISFGAIDGTKPYSSNPIPNECGSELAEVSAPIDKDPVIDRMNFQAKMVEEGVSLSMGFRSLITERPRSRLVCIGETHGDPNQHLEYIKLIKAMKPNTNALFIEVSSSLNGLFSKYYEGMVSQQDVMDIVSRDYQLSSHITPELLSLTKDLNMRIVGVESLSGAPTMAGMLNLESRNPYTASIMISFFNYMEPSERWRQTFERLEEGKFRVIDAIYIGGSGHLHFRNENFKSVSDILKDQGIELVKVLSLKASDMDWDIKRLISHPSYLAPKVTQSFAFLPVGETPIFMPELPIINTHQTTWTEYDMIIVRPSVLTQPSN